MSAVGPRISLDVVATARSRLEAGRAALIDLDSEAEGPDPERARGGRRRGRSHAPVGGVRRVELATQLVDDVLGDLVPAAAELSGSPLVTLVALGGYGRRELSLHSDVDLLFVVGEAEELRSEEVFVEALLYALWDLGLEVGHSVRSVDATLKWAEGEQTVLSSLLDARLLPGGSGSAEERRRTFETVERGIDELVSRSETVRTIISAKEEEAARRRERYGGTVYLLEPNLKESAGGLRDLHAALWISRVRFKTHGLDELLRLGVLSPEEHRNLWRAYDFLLRVRFELHRITGRRQDHLRFDHQERIAEILEYMDAGESDLDRRKHGVERFMRAYYFHARNLRILSQGLLERATKVRPVRAGAARPTRGGFRRRGRTITVSGADHFVRDPSAMVRIFEVAQEDSLEIHPHAKHLVSEQRGLLDKAWRRDRRVVEPFLSILEDPKHDASMVEVMHDAGLLKQIIPEMNRVTGRWQHSLYHVYTVDVHALKVLDFGKRMRRGDFHETLPALSRMMADLPRPSVLLLGCLLHDIGKGWPREDHSERGARVAAAVGRRFEEASTPGWSAEDSADLVWLVQDHLLMSDISQRRDVSDPELVAQFASTVRTEERLEMLYLLTVVDMMGTSPKVWTSWKAALLAELFVHARAALLSEDGEGARRHFRARRVRAREALLTALEGGRESDAAEARAFFDAVPDRYLLTESTRRMTRHVRMWSGVRRYGGIAVHVVHLPREGVSALTVVAADRPGLLAVLAGVLAAHDLSIVNASVFSVESHPHLGPERQADPEMSVSLRDFHIRPDAAALAPRIALDVLRVTDASGHLADDSERWHRVRSDLEALLMDGADAEAELAPRIWRTKGLRPPRPAVKTEVELVGGQGDDVVIDVFCEDHVGVLWVIARTLAEHRLAITLAKISTQGHRVADGFYVRDAETGARVEADRLRAAATAVREALERALVPAA